MGEWIPAMAIRIAGALGTIARKRKADIGQAVAGWLVMGENTLLGRTAPYA
jgi:hypothetical protein